MKYYIYIFLFFLVPGAQLHAQDSLLLIARPGGDHITLRWAPNNFQAWTALKTFGIVIERRTLGTTEFVPLTPSPILPQPLDAIASRQDAEDPMIIAAAQAMYGAAEFPEENVGPMGKALQQYESQQERLILALWAGDLSAEAAEILGLRYVDRQIVPGRPYEYRVRIASESSTIASSPPITVRAADAYAFGPVADFHIAEKDHKLILEWDYWANHRTYLGYYLEVSVDGENTFQRINEVPFIPSPEREKEGKYQYTIELENNYEARHYRIRGINSFGELSPPTQAILAKGIDLVPPPAAQFIEVQPDAANKRMTITWEAKEISADQKGFVVLKSPRYEGPYKAMHREVLPPFTRSFTDRAPSEFGINYYAIVSVDTAGNTLRSPVVIGQMKNTSPPKKPTGLTGRIDSTGAIFLMWEPGEEKDLLGYRVFTSNAIDREFLQLTDTLVKANFFFSKTGIKNLSETVYYQIMAVDHNYNTSAFSEVLQIKRPDKIAPSSPAIQSAQMRADGVWLSWIPSISRDVMGQEIWRQQEGGIWEFLQLIPNSKTSEYYDREVKTQHSLSIQNSRKG